MPLDVTSRRRDINGLLTGSEWFSIGQVAVAMLERASRSGNVPHLAWIAQYAENDDRSATAPIADLRIEGEVPLPSQRDRQAL